MQFVLLKNCTRELIPINVGDREVVVQRTETVQTSSGQVGIKNTEHRVSSSITLMPGEWTQVPGVVLKQRAIQRLLERKVLAMVKQTAPAADMPSAAMTVSVGAPLKSSEGSHPVIEEGTIAVKEILKKRTKKDKETDG